MEAAAYSAIASSVSALSALFTLYMFRAHGKGFVWTKDHKISLITDKDGNIHLQIEIPLFNFGKGNIRFHQLRAKKINLKSKAMENFDLDMDEAYFPEGVSIITYQTAIYSQLEPMVAPGDQLMITRSGIPDGIKPKEYQDLVNKHINEIPEHIVILKCTYRDGSWFGRRRKETVIGLSIKGLGITYLSSSRRKELDAYFAW